MKDEEHRSPKLTLLGQASMAFGSCFIENCRTCVRSYTLSAARSRKTSYTRTILLQEILQLPKAERFLAHRF